MASGLGEVIKDSQSDVSPVHWMIRNVLSAAQSIIENSDPGRQLQLKLMKTKFVIRAGKQSIAS